MTNVENIVQPVWWPQHTADGYFVGETCDHNGPKPSNTAAQDDWPEIVQGHCPRRKKDEQGNWARGWEQIENHTTKTWDGQAQTPTDYWLPGDTWDTPARHMTEFGPLPDGALLEPPVKPLAEAKSEAKAQLKAYRQSVEYGGFMLNGVRWDSEQKDELRLNSAYKLFEAGLSEYSDWKIAAGVYLTLTPELLQAATLALMQHYGAAFEVEVFKIAEIDALTSTAEVEAWLATELEKGWSQDA